MKPIQIIIFLIFATLVSPSTREINHAANRVVVTGNNSSWVLIVNVDRETGKLVLDENFRAKGANVPGVDFDRKRWPHGTSGKGVVHGAVFGPNLARKETNH